VVTVSLQKTSRADDGTPLHGIAISTRGRRYRWFARDDGHLSIDREAEPLSPGGTHWRCVGKRLGEAAIKAAIRAAVAELSCAKRTACTRIRPKRRNGRGHNGEGITHED